jgi:hypothetical protein
MWHAIDYRRRSDLLRPSLIHTTFYYKETMFKSEALSTEYDKLGVFAKSLSNIIQWKISMCEKKN